MLDTSPYSLPYNLPGLTIYEGTHVGKEIGLQSQSLKATFFGIQISAERKTDAVL